MKNGEGTRKLDLWIEHNIKDNHKDIEWTPSGFRWKYVEPLEDAKHIPMIPHYTTGDSIDPIWNLAKNYLTCPQISQKDESEFECKTTIFKPNTMAVEGVNVVKGSGNTEQLAIAEALFKAYQEKEDGE